MPVKSQQRAQTDAVRTLGRATTLSTVSSKTPESTPSSTIGSTKRNAIQARPKTDDNKSTSSGSASAENHSQASIRSKQLKIIAEVDETNIDEIFTSPGLTNVPKTFVTEIQQDQIYETIFHELQKKLPHRNPPNQAPPEIVLPAQDSEHQPPLSPHLLTVDDDEEEVFDTDANMIVDETSSIASSESIPSPTQDDYDTDIESEAVVHEDHDITGRTQYRELCTQSKIIPCSYFMAHIEDKEMTLRYHQFSTDDIRAITKTLCSNLSVERLYLDGNYLQQQAAKYVSRLLLVNDFITELSLADNRIGGGEGTKEICKMLTLNRNLKKINLSANRFNGLDVPQLVEAFEQCKTLRELDLSHNFFGEDCGKVLGTYISGNDSLESIDLSWNNIRGRGAIDVANGIKENVRLKRCNIEMNGFGPEGGQILGACIKQNGALEEFNISGNRLNTSNAFAIALGLLSNDSLQILKIADNQINSDGALAIFLCIKANESSLLREVDFSHTVVTQETADICEDIVKLKNDKFRYRTGKITPKILQPNSASDCYIKTDQDLLNKLRSNAAKVKAHVL
ncbi:unnamed protein product [Rotaria magnacalcarata]|uniref:Uncharacterized protein n=2 Tax=Rotaria magnacalcarata TaxID=392030 RepID=A0A817AEA1_9BILA|nr:unnamed protein product [Rotaria magnacalcarata]CAF1667302.1 unnamed protein product [Rotaria magnacalcarata]CAF2154479.1 unnamed protein product [Rotaria magnacalcarata]CAF2265129.1 unnamed protein product [Rotaria magnacalcarata]CAF3762053.1 unnamed protein product [Rotaria magnacalcarata]